MFGYMCYFALHISSDHHSGNSYTYGSKAVQGDVNSGGPSERMDFSMAKILANFDFKSPSFNQNPPHFTDEFSETIEWDKILPCFQHLPENIVPVLPLLLALLLHHYHADLESLGDENPLRLSPLWNEEDAILYRHHLYANLVGGSYGPDFIHSQELRDISSDQWCMSVVNLQSTIAIAQDVSTLVGRQGSTQACVHEAQFILGEVTGNPQYRNPAPPRTDCRATCQQADSFSATYQQPAALPAETEKKAAPAPGSLFRVLEQAVLPFKLPTRLSCKFAFYRMHTKGSDKLGLWRDKDGSMIDDSVVGKERSAMRELFNKAASVCKTLLGSNSHADIDKIGVDAAWTLCKQKVNDIWFPSLQFLILGDDGSPAVRTVFNVMHGMDTALSKESCANLKQQCLHKSIATQQLQKQPVLSFKPTTTTPPSEDLGLPEEVDDTSVRTNTPTTTPPPSEVLGLPEVVTTKDEDPVLEIDDTVECFVCEVCRPYRLYRHWSDYTRCAKSHLSSKDKHYFFKDEVRTARGRKIDPKVPTSRYVACTTPTFKHYSVEEKLIFFRQRIIHAGLLKKNDRVEIKLNDADPSTKKAVVVSGQLELKTKSWSVEVAILDSKNPLKLDTEHTGTEFIWVASILAILPSIQSPRASQFMIVQPTAASPAATQQKLQRRRLFGDIEPFRLAKTSEKLNSKRAGPITGPHSQAHWKPLGDSDYQLGIGAHIMLRDIAEFGKPLFIPIHKIHMKHWTGLGKKSRVPISFPIFEFNKAQFIESDFGLTFGGIYPDSVQKVMNAFRLDETNRCFYLALGIATNNDPFLLQCLFRKHAKYLDHNKDVVLRCIGDGNGDGGLKATIRNELDEAISITDCDRAFDCCGLRFFWPVEFDNFCIVILCQRGRQVFQSVYNASSVEKRIDSGYDGDSKKTIFLKLESGHYTLLTLVHGHIDVNIEETCWFLHDVDSQSRCPSVKTMQFQTYVNEDSYVATAVEGKIPSEKDVDKLYEAVIANHGITFDSRGTWLTGLPEGILTADWNQQGSLTPDSWNKVRNALMEDLLEEEVNPKLRSSRNTSKSPKVPVQTTVASTPVVFLDVGCESGRCLVRMLHDARITHVAGIELQPAWFKLSVMLFQELRTLFIDNGFTMPSITIFRSCLMSAKPELAYIYSICSIALMNNEVFDKKECFVAHRGANVLPNDVRNAPLYHMDGNVKKFLSPNAAFTLSRHFYNSTRIAVFKPEHFNALFDYSVPTTYCVKATWSRDFTTSSQTVSLMAHTQHVNITAGLRLVCASQKYVRLWQKYMRTWSSSLPPAFVIMRQTKYDPQQKHKKKTGLELGQGIGGNPFMFESESEDSVDDDHDTSDLEAILPDIRELGNLFPAHLLNIQQLASLNTRQMLHETILIHYMLLLERKFPLLSFRPTMFSLCGELRLTHSRTLKERQDQCRKYIFHKQPTNKGTFIFALNPGLHWIAFKIDFSKKYIASMCSLQDRNVELVKGVRSWISSFWAEATTFEHFSVHVPNQRNAVDCGPLCCMFLLFLSQNDISRSTALEYDTISTAYAMRMRIFADIVQQKITPLVTKS